MNEVQIFKSEEFGEIRTVTIDNEPWLVGKDVAEALGYQNASKALADHVDEEDKLNNESLSSLGQRGGWLINESGMYSLVLSSKLPSAKKFRRWITSEVLPSIRKNGGYIAGQETLSDDELLEKAVLVARKRIAERDAIIAKQNERIADMRPKEIFADAVAVSHTSILVRELAKVLKGNGIDIGQNRLFGWLRDNGYLIKSRGIDWNSPMQKAMNMGLFEVRESTRQNPDGSVSIDRVTKVTGRGQVYFVNKFLGDKKNAEG